MFLLPSSFTLFITTEIATPRATEAVAAPMSAKTRSWCCPIFTRHRPIFRPSDKTRPARNPEFPLPPKCSETASRAKCCLLPPVLTYGFWGRWWDLFFLPHLRNLVVEQVSLFLPCFPFPNTQRGKASFGMLADLEGSVKLLVECVRTARGSQTLGLPSGDSYTPRRELPGTV
jgi:hypothetical protein